MTPDLSKTQIEQVRGLSREEITHATKVQRRARAAEDYGFFAGIALAVLVGLAEIAAYVAVSFGWVPRHDAPFPWIIVALFAGCVLPKTLGRATAGKIWEILAQRFAGKVTP